jgi:predicted ATPase
MLLKYKYGGRKFTFAKKTTKLVGHGNVFTIIVGKNGTGKSRLLRSVTLDLLRDKIDLKKFIDIAPDFRTNPVGEIEASHIPTKVICASTSPFDKFPVLRRHQRISYYSYLGLRGLTTNNLGLAYMARIIYTLIDAAMRNEKHARAIADVLDYLGYNENIKVSFAPISPTFLKTLLSSENPRDLIKNFSDRPQMFSSDSLLMRPLLESDERTLNSAMQSVARMLEGSVRSKIDVYLGASGVNMRGRSSLSPEDIVLLGRYGFLRLRDVELEKKNANESLVMSEMSSGEQSVIMSLLGIGSQIEDGALVCIDEPEVCLHPEWQERYIQLLSRIFSHYSGCHFLIATHSPQIVAQLPKDACYVMQMEDGIVHKSSEFANHSIDFQLARLFNAPGYKNEYLSRVALNTFMKVAKEKAFDADSLSNVSILNRAYDNLQIGDPLREIFEAILEMQKKYG